jgi:Erg28 like protein
VLARVFAVWTTMTCVLCVLSAFALRSVPILVATIFSFAAALGFFALELAVFRTMSLRTFASPCVVASAALVWLCLHVAAL